MTNPAIAPGAVRVSPTRAAAPRPAPLCPRCGAPLHPVTGLVDVCAMVPAGHTPGVVVPGPRLALFECLAGHGLFHSGPPSTR